jgi:hypothetical protein
LTRSPSPTRGSESLSGIGRSQRTPRRLRVGLATVMWRLSETPHPPPPLIRVVLRMIASSFRFTGRRVYLTTLAVWTQRWHGLARCNAPGFPLYSDPLHKAASGTTCETRRSWPRRSSRSELASCVIVGVSARERPSKRQASVDAQAAICSLDLRLAWSKRARRD